MNARGKMKKMMLTVPEPKGYYCDSDEDHFFAWLESIPSIDHVVGVPGGLALTIDTPMDQLSFYELVGLMTRYQLDRRCLRPLCEAQANPWFTDAKNYWYASVFA